LVIILQVEGAPFFHTYFKIFFKLEYKIKQTQQ